MAKTVILKSLDENKREVRILPITRGELVLDSSGNPAFHSNEFLATESRPGLTKLSTNPYSNDATIATTPAALKTVYDEVVLRKVDKESGKGLSTNDYTENDKNKLASIAEGADVNVQSDWSETSSDSDAYIQNKPTHLTHFENDLKVLHIGTKKYNGEDEITIDKNDLGLSSALLYRGITEISLEDESEQNSIVLQDGTPLSANPGDVVFSDDKEFVWNGYKWEELGGEVTYKVIQTAVADPDPEGSDLAFISNITQDANGVIAATKKTVQSASKDQAGIVTTDEQTFSGDKIFIKPIYMDTNKYNSISSASSSYLDLNGRNYIRFNINNQTRLCVYANSSAVYLRPNFPSDSNLPVSLGYSGYYFTTTYTKNLYLYPTSTSNTLYIAGFTTTPTESQNTPGQLYASSQIKVINGTSSTNAYMQAPGGFYETSDARLKNFVEDVPCDFNKLALIPKKYFTWKSGDECKLQIGTSAQAVREIYPELVSEDENGILSVAYDKLSIVALSAIDKLHAEVKALKSKNQELEDRLSKLEKLLLNGKEC